MAYRRLPPRQSRRPSSLDGGNGVAPWKNVLGVSLIASVLLVLAAGFYLLFQTRQQHVAIDPDSFCPRSGPKAITAILIDTTDSLNVVQRTDLMNQIETLIAAIPRFGALQVYAVGPVQDRSPEPLFSKCNPGRGDEIREFNDNPRLVERDWREGFRQPLERALAGALAPGGAKVSPILESIQWVAVRALAQPANAAIPRHLVVVSDLLQHTPGLSLYGSIVRFKDLQKSPYYTQIRAPLDDVMIELLVINRKIRNSTLNSDLIKFWVEYFDAQRVKGVHIINLAG